MIFFFPNQKGQSLIEVIVAMAVFSVIASAIMSVTLGSLSSLTQGGDETEARALATQGLEALKSVRDHAWNSLTHSPAMVSIASSVWNLTDAVSEVINDKYTRTLTVANVCRDLNENIATCPAAYTDPHTKFATVTVSFVPRTGATNTVTQTALLTNWDSRDFTQSDWVGGSGQSSFTDTTKYSSQDGNLYDGTSGQISLAQAANGTWSLSSGSEMTDVSDVEFNLGTHTNTTVSGVGDVANVVLSQASNWVLNIDTGSETRNSIVCTSSSNCWTAGNSGALAQWNGTSWTTSTIPSSANINSLYAVSASDIYAAGASGRIWHYNGTAWSLNIDTGSQTWNSVICTSSSNCWTAGNSGALAQWNGTSWTTSTIPSSANINSLYAVSATDIFAVGASGRIWHYNGTAWSLNIDTGSETRNSIVCTSSSNCWAAGNSGALAQWNGTSWTTSTIPSSANINSLYAVSATDIFAVGASGRIWYSNGTAWSLHTDTGSETWRAVYMLSSNSGWTVDTGGRIQEYSNSYQPSGVFESRIFDGLLTTATWDVVSWSEIIPTGGDVTISVRSGNTATPDGTWTSWSGELTDPLGSSISNTGRYFQYRATFTRPTDAQTTAELEGVIILYNKPTNNHLNAVEMVAENNGWIVGANGTILHYNGTAWSVFSSPVGSDLSDVSMVSATDGFIVGAQGKILRYNGTIWIEFADTGNETWNAITMFSSTDGWAVGNGGAIAHWNGTFWDDSVSSPTGSTLHDVYAIASDDVYAVGADNSGEVIHFDGTTWSLFTNVAGNSDLQSVMITNATDGWALGDNGLIVRYDGTIWNSFQTTGVDTWRDGVCMSVNDCWVVGDNGLLARWNGSGNVWDTTIVSGTTRQLNGVDFSSGTNGWAAGNNGTILHYTSNASYQVGGSLISSAFNMTNASPVQILEWDESKPANTNIQFQVRTAPDASGSPGTWTSWYGANGIGTYFTITTGSLVPLGVNGNQWVQYRAELSGDGFSTPVLQEVRVNYK